MKPICINQEAVISEGKLAGLKGIVIAASSEENLVTLQVEHGMTVALHRDYVHQDSPDTGEKITLEELLRMTDRELDAMVSEHVYQIPTAITDNILHMRDHPFAVPFYSTDITKAWDVLETMRRPFSRRQAFVKRLYDLMHLDVTGIRIAPLEVVWNLNPKNICCVAIYVMMHEKKPELPAQEEGGHAQMDPKDRT